MLPSDPHHADGYPRFAAEHLALALAVAGQAISDPALTLDIASEAIAMAYAAEQADDTMRAVLDAVEHVFRASVVNGLVPKLERLRLGDPRPATLAPHVLAGIAQLSRKPLPPGSPAEHVAAVLRRDQPDAAALRQIRGSGLVRAAATTDRDSASREPGS